MEIAMNFHHLESGRSFVIELDEFFVLCVNCKRTISKSPDMNSPADASHVVISSDLLLSLLERAWVVIHRLILMVVEAFHTKNNPTEEVRRLPVYSDHISARSSVHLRKIGLRLYFLVVL